MIHGERFNGVTHLVGTALALAGLPLLVVQAARSGRAMPVITFSIFGTCLVALYLVSTLYHSLRGRAKRVFRVLDHASIFVLIAGTYTPVALVSVGGAVGWTLFGVNWGLAVVGIVLSTLRWRHARKLTVPLYVIMGWLALGAIEPVVRGLGAAGFAWIVAGGLFYTTGLAFYAWKRLPHHHGVWHLFVIAGSLCHFAAVFLFVRA
jgi:hemolysin III